MSSFISCFGYVELPAGKEYCSKLFNYCYLIESVLLGLGWKIRTKLGKWLLDSHRNL